MFMGIQVRCVLLVYSSGIHACEFHAMSNDRDLVKPSTPFW